MTGLVGCNDDGSCGGSVQAACGEMNGCPTTWAAAHDIAAWGLTETTCGNQTDQIQLSTCPNVLVARRKSVDTGYVYYFHPASGELYRIDYWVAVEKTGPQCVVGDGPAPECDDPDTVYPCGYSPR
ncbi:MAG: hypothetical protein ABJE66_05245 [Deltaproteobacteria bacterium]